MLFADQPLRVLLIDDDESYCVYLRGLIEQLAEPSWRLEWCSSFGAGCATLAVARYDLCILDYHLDEGDGLQLLAALRTHNNRLPVLLLTASDDHAVYEQAMTLGISGYLIKTEVTLFLLERSLRLALQLTPAQAQQQSRDAMTGLPDSPAFHDHLRRCLRQLTAETVCAVLLCKLTRVQLHTDSLDPGSGELLLRLIADRLRQHTPAGALPARCGADEFAVLLPAPTTAHAVQRLADALSEHLDQPLRLPGQTLTPGMRIGIAFGTRTDTASAVLANARLALQQPQTLPPRRNVLPSTFIPHAEESGLIIPIGWWVLETAARDLHRLQQHSPTPLSVSVNLSACQLIEPTLLARIDDLLQRTPLAPGWLTLEITETALLQHTDLAVAKLKVLRVLGVECHIDDFGTGYSSLSHVQQFPSTALKLDRSFVNGMLRDPAHRAIVETVISLAHRLDKIVIAEGIETLEQYELLRALHCDCLQGYWLSPPLNVTRASRWLEQARQHIDRLLVFGT